MLSLLLTGCVKDDIAPTEPAPDNNGEVIAGDVMVKFSPEVAELLEQQTATRSGAVTRSGATELDCALEAIGGYSLERIFPTDSRTEERTRRAGLHRWYLVRYNAPLSAEEVAARLAPLGDVQKVNPRRKIYRNYTSKAMPLSGDAIAALRGSKTRAGAAYPYNDDLLPLQWHIINRGTMFQGVGGTAPKSVVGADVQVEGAWERSTGSPAVVVAVLDEGVFLEHPDLKHSIWENEDEIYRSHDDNDNNGYAGDRHGYNFVKNSGVITWNDIHDSGHASHVAGVIAAQNNNGEGISSIAGGTAERPGVRIMSCQIFSGSLQTDSYSSIRAIKYAADNGAHVLQCSWGYVSGEANIYDWGSQGFTDEEQWAEICPLEKEVLDYFTHNAGSPDSFIEGGIAVFASGNEYAPMAGFPGAAANHISVAATAADFTPAVYTNYGPGTTVCAPGGDQNYYYEYFDDKLDRGELGCVLSTLPYHVAESGYGYMEGTSMACPHVSGVVALALSYAAEQHRHFTATEIKELICSTATSIDSYCVGTKSYYHFVADLGTSQMMQTPLGQYRSKMGAGQINATRLLAAMDGAGTATVFPNLYIGLGGQAVVDPALYLDCGGNAVTVDIDNTEIASATANAAGRLVVTGLKEGVTKATVRYGSSSQRFNITVRKHAGDFGWL